MASPKNLVQEPKMNVLKSRDISKPSFSNYYQVYIAGIKKPVLGYIEKNYGVPGRWISEQAGLMCSDATLPTSSFATAEVKDNFHGINEQYAHTRLYVDTDFTFYVDKNYQMIKVFEGWMDYISGNNNQKFGQTNPNYFRRFNYPLGDTGYKTDTLYITKFEKDTTKQGSSMLTYQFYNVFPKSMGAIPVSYGAADLLKVTVTFAYDRYIIVQGRGNSTGSSTTGSGETPVQPQPETPSVPPIGPLGEPVEVPKWWSGSNESYYESYFQGVSEGNSNINRARESATSSVKGPRER